MMETFRIALDWTPNTNHIGFYIGQAKGWYQEVGIDVHLLPPSESYATEETPGHKVMTGHADLGIAPSETVISCWCGQNSNCIAVAALLQKDASAIVTLQSSGIDQLRKLDGKKYACFGAKYEMNMVKELIRQNGGEGNVIEDNPPRLSSFNQVLDGNADATWIFLPWEGVHADMNEVPLNVFPIGETYGNIPYGYSPVLFACPDILKNEARASKLQALLAVTARGYQFAVENPEEAVDLLVSQSHHPTLEQVPREFLLRSLQYLINNNFLFTEDGRWGVMKPDRWNEFTKWLLQRKYVCSHEGQAISEEELDPNCLFTNIFLSLEMITRNNYLGFHKRKLTYMPLI